MHKRTVRNRNYATGWSNL